MPYDFPFETGEKAKGRAVVSALRALQAVERGEPTEDERRRLAAFPGFGCVALSIFPDPSTGRFKSADWQAMGEEVERILTPDEYASARRSVFNAFYTSPLVMRAVYTALDRLGLPGSAHVLEPGCGNGGFMSIAPTGLRFTGIEMDAVSGRIARALYPQHDIRIENFRDTRLNAIDAVIGNVPFADITLDHDGHRFSLHDYFFAKSIDMLSPGGVLGLITSRFTLDKVDASIREYLAARADFLGAIRLPDDAFKDQGTRVVTDIVFLRKRHDGEQPQHAGSWLELTEVEAGDRTASINAWFAERPDMVLGDIAVTNGMYGRDTLKVTALVDFERRLSEAVLTLPEHVYSVDRSAHRDTPRAIPAGHEEGSFVIADGTIMQLECGELVPVTHGQTALTANGGLMGRRLAALIELRDRARAVLKTQNEGRPVDERVGARRALNRSYDRFRSTFGPVNRTTLSRTAQGTEIRRMPNLVRFREDPDAFLAMSLEDYDETTGLAEKAPIMREDVVGPASPVMSVSTAEEGLLVSLNERGRVDLDYIARLYGKDPDRVIAELGDLIYRDPSDGHVTRDEYLSGNVRRKLAEARDPRNIAALEAVQPEDLLPGDIDANLGAPWLPIDVIREFAADLFAVEVGSITVDHLPIDALWTIEGDREAMGSVQNTEEYGTKRMDGLALLDGALNLRTPTIYDEYKDADGNTKRVVNQEETIAAREKQKRIKQRFAGWVFADPDRAERLVRIYNDGFNNIRVRQFDGSHLTFPGMNRTFTLRPHQIDAVWRIMSDGNTLLAHAVGAGKTALMATAAMKLKQAALVRKSLLVVPNHMLEQFGREFLRVYPNARVLIAGKDDLARDRRKLLTAKIATGNWDAIVMTHSSFERVGMSRDFQVRFMQEQIAEYQELLIDAKAKDGKAARNIIKVIEKRKAGFAQKIEDLMAEDKKDDGLVFDDLGVDQIFIDEVHYMKNLETASKMDRVAGIQTEGSQRAFDLLMKSRYIDEKTPGRGFVGATGTPISNTMVEMYTLQRYMAPVGLAERSIGHFDAWAAAFGEIVDTMEISPDGSSLRPNARFSKFVNLPELQQMFRSFADVQTADMLKLPVPRLNGGKAEIVSCPMSDAQSAIQAELVDRYERIRGGGVSPRDDNALVITTDGRKLALDARLVDVAAEANPDGKVAAMLDNAVSIWKRTGDIRATQMIFCDIGVNPTEWGFSVYDEIKRGLVERSVPGEQIADIGDANSDAKKEALFENMRAGTVRFMLGSTAKMGTGTNVQTRLIAMHHLDAPWKPAEIEQRDGRILRQGNRNKEVEIYRYVTEGSFDAYMWQTLQNKARFIAQVMKGDLGVRRASDIGGQELSFAEVKAIASGNPAVLTLAEIDADIQRLTLLKRSHADEQYRARQQVKSLPGEIERLDQRAADYEADHQAAVSAGDCVTVGARTYADREKATEVMNAVLRQHLKNVGLKPRRWEIGSYRGFSLSLEADAEHIPELVVTARTTHRLDFRNVAAGALLNRIDGLVAKLPAHAQETRDKRRLRATQLEGFQARVGLAFDGEGRMVRLHGLRFDLETLLSDKAGDRSLIDSLVAEYQAMKMGERIDELVSVVEEQPAPVKVPPATLPAPGTLTEAWQASLFTPPTPPPVKQHSIKPVQMAFQF